MSGLESWMNQDWSDTWQPLPKKLADHKDFELHIKSIAVSPEDKASFQEQGYWISPQIIDEDTIKLLNSETKRVFQGEVDFSCAPCEYDNWINAVRNTQANDPKLRLINNAWYVNHAYRRLGSNSAIGSIASQLLNTEEIRLWHDEVGCKPSDDKKSPAGIVGWHQDYSHWQMSNTSNMLTAWIPLQDMTVENGGLRALVGSHKWGLAENASDFYNKDINEIKDKVSAIAKGPVQDQQVAVKAGQVVFIHALTFYGSGPNLSDSPRSSIGLHLMPHACAYAPKHGYHLNMKVLGPNARSGMLFEGDDFPLLYRKRRPSANYDYP